MNNILALNSYLTSGLCLTIEDSTGISPTFHTGLEALEYLCEQSSPNTFLVAWDLNTFLAPLFKLLPSDIVDKLNNGERGIWPPFRLFYCVGKGRYLGISAHYRDYYIYELKTFFPGEPAPDTLQETASKGAHLLQVLSKMGMTVNNLTSPAKIYEDSILRKMGIPTLYTLPESSIPMMEKCWNYIREWRSVYKIGAWEQGSAWDYDLSSAYPSELAKLPNIYKAEFIHTESANIPSGNIWGILDGIVTVKAPVSPLVASDGICRAGTYPDLITLEEWDCLKRWNIGSFVPKEGWFFRVPYPQYLFNYAMRRLYEQRNSPDKLQSTFAKSAAVSVWGKLQEVHGDKYGDFCNFIYASMTASRIRIKDCDFIYSNKLQDDLISVQVDGCLATKQVNVSSVKSFGEWRVNPPSPALVLNTTYQWTGDKRPNGHNVAYMLDKLKEHPHSSSLGDILLPTLETDRNFSELPQRCSDLLKYIYPSTPLSP